MTYRRTTRTADDFDWVFVPPPDPDDWDEEDDGPLPAPVPCPGCGGDASWAGNSDFAGFPTRRVVYYCRPCNTIVAFTEHRDA